MVAQQVHSAWNQTLLYFKSTWHLQRFLKQFPWESDCFYGNKSLMVDESISQSHKKRKGFAFHNALYLNRKEKGRNENPLWGTTFLALIIYLFLKSNEMKNLCWGVYTVGVNTALGPDRQTSCSNGNCVHTASLITLGCSCQHDLANSLPAKDWSSPGERTQIHCKYTDQPEPPVPQALWGLL